MARIVNLNLEGQPWGGLERNERLEIPIETREGFTGQMLVMKDGVWAGEHRASNQVYFVLRGNVFFEGAERMGLREGQAVVYDPGEAHTVRVETGAVVLHWSFGEVRG
jgi:mannose-6-phosphate isomerase-like protein (cupin superfamily)